MSSVAGTMSKEKGFITFVRNHPLVSFFFLVYGGMRIVICCRVMNRLGL